MKEVLIIIPAYNEQECIEKVVDNLINNYKEYDYVIVNDGSKDNTRKICKEKNYNLIDLPINLGLAGGFQAAMKYAYVNGYSYAVQFDADGQHRPEYIANMLEAIKEGFDIVIGSRFVSEKKPFTMRMLGSRLISTAIFLTSRVRVKDPTSGMRMYDRKMINEFATSLNYGPEPDTMSYLIKNGAKIKEVQAFMDERQGGESYLTALKSAKYMIRMLTSILIIQNFRKRETKFID